MPPGVANSIEGALLATSKAPLREITDEAGYDRAVRSLDALLDAGRADEDHPLAPLAAALGRSIGDYDDRHFPLGRDPSTPDIPVQSPSPR